jgi:Mitochondrial carrier protein
LAAKFVEFPSLATQNLHPTWLLQKESPIVIIRNTLRTKGITGLYSGCTALIVGNSIKAGVRFVSYDYFKQKLADSEVW